MAAYRWRSWRTETDADLWRIKVWTFKLEWSDPSYCWALRMWPTTWTPCRDISRAWLMSHKSVIHFGLLLSICGTQHSTLPLCVSRAKRGLRSCQPLPRSAGLQERPDPGPPGNTNHFVRGRVRLLYRSGSGTGRRRSRALQRRRVTLVLGRHGVPDVERSAPVRRGLPPGQASEAFQSTQPGIPPSAAELQTMSAVFSFSSIQKLFFFSPPLDSANSQEKFSVRRPSEPRMSKALGKKKKSPEETSKRHSQVKGEIRIFRLFAFWVQGDYKGNTS
ncbi:uncharacterized protein LOC144001528 isoform X1 [Festucalex cinctus]